MLPVRKFACNLSILSAYWKAPPYFTWPVSTYPSKILLQQYMPEEGEFSDF